MKTSANVVSMLLGAPLVLAVVGWFALAKTEASKSKQTPAAATVVPPADRSPAPPSVPQRSEESQSNDSLTSLLGAAVRIVDQATRVAGQGADDESLQSFITTAADGVRAGLDVADSLLPPLEPGVAKAFGDTFRESALRDHSRINDTAVSGLVNSIWEEVVLASGERPDSLTLMLLEDPKINAYAFVGRNVVVNRGFIDFAGECSRTRDVIRFVLAHELAHIILGHTDTVFRRMVAAEQLIPSAGVAPLVIESIVKQTPINQMSERDADCFARKLHVTSGWSLEGGREFFERMMRLSGRPDLGAGISSLFASHPDESQRVDMLSTGTGCDP